MTPVSPIPAAAAERPQGIFPDDLVAPARNARADGASLFTDMVTEGLAKVNSQLAAGEVSLQRLATGDTQNLHQVMIQLEESRLSFQLMMQVRGRLLEAYQDIMKMQI